MLGISNMVDSMSKSIWETLSVIDCNEHVKSKGGFSYLAWTWAIAMVKQHYPEMTFKIRKPITYDDETVMVRTKVTIEGMTHECWLPVTDFKNKAISSPDAFDRNTATMRCLVKNFAFFGLGHYIYAGESLPQEPPRETFTAAMREVFIRLIAEKDGWGLKRFGQDVGNDIMTDLFSSFQKGEVSKTKALVREYVGQANTGLKDGLEALEHYILEGSQSAAEEVLAEMLPIEREFVVAGLSEVQKRELTGPGLFLH